MEHLLGECDLFEGYLVPPPAGVAGDLNCDNFKNIHKMFLSSGMSIVALGLGEQYSLHASDPHMGWDDSGTKALVGSQFVLARDVEFSCAASLTFVSWNGSARGSL